MSEIRSHHSDKWGACLEYPEQSIMEIRWYDTTRDMGGEDFNEFLVAYVGAIEKSGSRLCLVDGVQFEMDMAKMSMGWRDENIIPRYNAAGVRKFAFIMPTGMPAIGAAPKAEGPADFPTGYFGTRADALAWLAAED